MKPKLKLDQLGVKSFVTTGKVVGGACPAVGTRHPCQTWWERQCPPGSGMCESDWDNCCESGTGCPVTDANCIPM